VRIKNVKKKTPVFELEAGEDGKSKEKKRGREEGKFQGARYKTSQRMENLRHQRGTKIRGLRREKKSERPFTRGERGGKLHSVERIRGTHSLSKQRQKTPGAGPLKRGKTCRNIAKLTPYRDWRADFGRD